MSGVAVWVGIGAVGAIGAVLRFVVDGAVAARWRGAFPAGTLVVNVSGAFLLGALVGLGPSGDAMRLAGTGLLGSYTTFSTWMLETHRAGENAQDGVMAANVLVSLAAGLGGAVVGRALGRAL